MSKVCFFMPSLVGGGAERVTLDLCRGLASLGEEVTLVLANVRGELSGEVAELAAGVDVVDLQRSRTTGSIAGLARHLRRSQPDVVVGVLPHAGLVCLAARALAGTPARSVVMVHNQMSVNVKRSPRLRDRVVPALCRMAFPRADVITAVSRGVADDFAATTGIRRERVTVFPNPIDFDRIRRRAEAPLPEWWGGSERARTVVAAGRLVEQKDFTTLLEAVAQMDSDVRVAILGEGPERAALEQQASLLGLEDRVVLPGYVPNPFPLFRSADAFVLSSRWEGLPTVLLEVMAFDTPIVATDCPSGPDEILDGGRLGRLVPVADPPAMAEALSASVGDRAGQADRDGVREYFAIDAVARRFRELW